VPDHRGGRRHRRTRAGPRRLARPSVLQPVVQDETPQPYGTLPTTRVDMHSCVQIDRSNPTKTIISRLDVDIETQNRNLESVFLSSAVWLHMKFIFRIRGLNSLELDYN
jgi:hypothetical protein